MDVANQTLTKSLLRLYQGEHSPCDIVGEYGFSGVLIKEFGERLLRGTAVGMREGNIITDVEQQFRDILRPLNIKRAVEIGTFRGVSSAVIAHYADNLMTVDLNYCQTALELWWYFGVKDKIEAVIIDSDDDKEQLLGPMDFDFAFIDGSHEREDVAFDFEQVKKCGRVLFHDYGIDGCPGPTEFIDTLPDSQVKKMRPFALWTNG